MEKGKEIEMENNTAHIIMKKTQTHIRIEKIKAKK